MKCLMIAMWFLPGSGKLCVAGAPPVNFRGSGSACYIAGMSDPARATPYDFAADSDAPIPYIRRTRDYYQGLGYGAPYEWAHYAQVPFARLSKPLAQSRIAIVTTAAPYQPDKGDQGPGAPYNAAAKFFSVYSGATDNDPDLRISHVSIDRKHTTAQDQASYFPLSALRRAAGAGRIGEVAPRFHGLPTNRSHRVTLDTDCPELVSRCLQDKADAALLLGNCPVCHQSVSLAARALETAGIATVVMGCAKDIVEHVGVPRFLFSDFPLGNAAGRPNDRAGQDETLGLALGLLERAFAPRTTLQNPLRWSDDPSWKRDYANIELLSAEDIARRRADFEKQKQVAHAVRGQAFSGPDPASSLGATGSISSE